MLYLKSTVNASDCKPCGKNVSGVLAAYIPYLFNYVLFIQMKLFSFFLSPSLKSLRVPFDLLSFPFSNITVPSLDFKLPNLVKKIGKYWNTVSQLAEIAITAFIIRHADLKLNLPSVLFISSQHAPYIQVFWSFW